MAGGVAFDPAEFAAFKSGRGSDRGGQDEAPSVAFNPAEFKAFKERAVAPRGSGASPASFDDRFGSGPMASTLDTSTPLGAGLRRTADEELVGKPDASTPFAAALLRAGNAAGLNLPRNAAAAIASAPMIGNGRSFSENYSLAKDQEEALARQAPKSAMAGTAAGIVGGAVALPAFRAAEGAGLVGRGIANAGTGFAYGGAAELADTKDPYSAAGAAALGGVAGGVGGAVIDKLAPPVITAASRALAPVLERFGAGSVASSGGFTPAAREALRAAGLDADNLPPELAAHVERVFAAKGASPAAAREAQAAEFGLPLSRGQATQDPAALAAEGRALAGRSGARAQGIGEEFAGRQAEAVANQRDSFLGMAAGEAPRVANPREAFEAAADRARQAQAAQAEQASVAQRGVDDALRAVRGRGDGDALDSATAAASGVRDAAEQARGAYRAAYGEAGQFPGEFMPGALDRAGSRVRDRLGADVPIDDVLTPAASRAIADLDAVPGLFNLGPGEGPNLQQVEQLRKRLVTYRGATATNPTDRRAMDRILAEFDNHLEAAMGSGLFGPRSAAGSRNLPADGFPGDLPATGALAALPPAGGASARTGNPETLTQYLARTGGIPLDAEARASDFHRTYIPGRGTLARHDAPTWDQIRVRMAEEGFLPPDMTGAASARDVADWVRNAIHDERVSGRPTVRMADQEAAAGRRAAEAVADLNADHAAMVDRQARRMAIDLEGYGFRPQDLDRAALNDAAEHIVLGRHTDPADAYEAALMAREGASQGRAGAAQDVPFDGPTSLAASDALPGADMAPLEAMQRARGLFRDYKQAFAPRFSGDTAGNNLRRILERDASPNEVAAMLFGSPGTGRVQSGQLQTLARLRDAVGADSDTWAAVQRGVIARHLGGEGRDLGARLDYLLRGEGRNLTSFLSEEQRAGLGRLRSAVAQAESAGRPVPTWASDLERSGFDPNAVSRSIFGGSGGLGSKPGAAAEAQAAKAFLGGDSAEWAGLRQAAVHRLLDPEAPAAKTVAALRDFTTGSGKGVAGALFNREELAHLNRFAAALQSTIRPNGTAKTGAGAEIAKKAAAKALDLVMGAVALKVGGLPAAAGTLAAKPTERLIAGGLGTRAARRSFEGGAPRVRVSLPSLPPLGSLATGEGLAVGQQ